jgi:hypothetical protein
MLSAKKSDSNAGESLSSVDDLLCGPTSLFRMKSKGSGVYQFKITLQDVKPAVWRRIQTPAAYTFWDLHVAIQDAVGWRDAHLHEFRILEPKTHELDSIGIPDDDDFAGDKEVVPGWKRAISDYFSADNPTAKYVYDFGDDWNHEVIFEDALPAEQTSRYPICLDGRGACPPEDCGGPYGYAEFLRAIKKPGSPRGGELLEWVGGSFDPHGFDLKDVAFDDPEARWTWAFNESILLDNDVLSMQTSPRKPDRYGRVPFHLPLAQHALILRHPAELNAILLEQFGAASRKDGMATVKLDVDELKSLCACLSTISKTMRQRLDRRILIALRSHFLTMESMIRGI